MAHVDPAESYVVVIIIVIVEESQEGEDILVRIFSTLGVEGSLSLLD